MDFHSLSRKDLQTLCKKNKIAANITNVAMVDALQALEIVEGIEDLHQQSVPSTVRSLQESPEKTEARSPRTCRRTSTRTRTVKDPSLESSVALTRTRRGTAAAKASTTARRRICKEEDQEKEESSDLHQILLENKGSELPETPAARNGRKRVTAASVQRKIEAEVEKEKDEKENDNPVATTGLRTYSTRRSSRLSEKILQEATPTPIQKSRGRKQVIKIAALSEGCEDPEINSKEDSRSSGAKNNEKDTVSDLTLPKPKDLSEITGGYEEGEKRDSDPMASVDASAANLLSESLGCISIDDQASKEDTAASEDLEWENSPTVEKYVLPECKERRTDADLDHDLEELKPFEQVRPECEESRTDADLDHDLEELKPTEQVQPECEESRTDADLDHDLEELKPSEQVPPECEESRTDADLNHDLEKLKSSNRVMPEREESRTDADLNHDLEELKSSNQVMPEREESRTDADLGLDLKRLKSSDQAPPECEESWTDADFDLDLALKEMKSSQSRSFPDADAELDLGTDPEAGGDEDQCLLGDEALVAEGPKEECENLCQDLIGSDQNLKTSSAIHIPEEGGESGGNAIADSSSSAGNLNPALKLEFAHLSSSMKILALDHPQDLHVENIANSTDDNCFGGSETCPMEMIPPTNNTDLDFFGDFPAGNQSLVGSPASLRRKKVSAPNQVTPLGSMSGGVLELGSEKRKLGLSSNKRGTATTPIRSNIFEDVDKENKGSEKKEMKMIVNGEGKEQRKLNDLSMRQLKKLLKETKDELSKRSVLKALSENINRQKAQEIHAEGIE